MTKIEFFEKFGNEGYENYVEEELERIMNAINLLNKYVMKPEVTPIIERLEEKKEV